MNKMIRSYKRSTNLSRTPAQMVAFVFSACAFQMEKIGHYLLEKKYYERALASEKIVMAMTNLPPLLADGSDDQKMFSQKIGEFCYLILANLTEVNQKENHQLCLQTEKLLQEMASIWQNV